MRKIIVCIMMFCTFGAYAETNDNASTSREYVDAALATRQPDVPAEGADIVMTYDSTATDGIGTKEIYDTTAGYASQETALVTAATANGAVQMALNGELSCHMYNPDDANDCWLWNLNTVAERTLPAGYTALPYLESTGTQYLDLGQPIGSGENIKVKFAFTKSVHAPWFGALDGTTIKYPGFDFHYVSANPLQVVLVSRNVFSDSPIHYYAQTECTLETPYILQWNGNPLSMPTFSPSLTIVNLNITNSNYLYTPTRNAYLFTVNSPGTFSKRPMRIYYFRVEGKMNLIPARRDSDGELGMYDTVSGTFFTNQGAGKFISGVYTEHVN